MKKSIFDDLDFLIEQAVFDATNKEALLQSDQEKKVKKAGLSKKANDKKSDVEESDEEEQKKDSENIKKIKGKPDDVSSQDSKKDTPGTKTSKKLLDPTEKELKNPQYNDIEKKINALRGGNSLKKQSISMSVKEYLGSLNPPEKSALLTYLTDLAQIMAPTKTGKEVKDPKEVGIEITFKDKVSKEAPEDDKKSSKEEKSKKPKKDDGVIVVGEQ